MPELDAQVAELKTEVKYLKWIIPAACGFVALLILVFWGVERKNIGAKVKEAIQAAGAKAALEEAESAANDATQAAGSAKASAEKATLDAEKLIELLGKAETAAAEEASVFEVSPEEPVAGYRDFTWERPPRTTFAIVGGCGAGGGGAPGIRVPRPPEPKFAKGGAEYGRAYGGDSGVYRTVLVGPLTQKTYTVRLGAGGAGGEALEFSIKGNPHAGRESSFFGADLSAVVFPGGDAGKLDQQNVTKKPETGRDGEDGPRPNTGGKGGAKYKNGSAATGPCAGGGGTGPNRNSDNKARGGRGGHGLVVVQPLLTRPGGPTVP